MREKVMIDFFEWQFRFITIWHEMLNKQYGRFVYGKWK